MGKPYSIDLRERVKADIETGQSRRASARRYDVSSSFAVKLAASQELAPEYVRSRWERASQSAGRWITSSIRRSCASPQQHCDEPLPKVRRRLSCLFGALSAGRSYGRAVVCCCEQLRYGVGLRVNVEK